MKKLCLLFLIFAIGWTVYWLLLHPHPVAKPAQAPTNNFPAQPIPRTPQGQQVPTQNIGQPSVQSTNASTVNLTNKPHTIEEWLEREYSRPFLFYGKVVDQDGAPVQGATATFQWANAKGDGQYASAISDTLGLFSLKDQKGYKLLITVSKIGYYTPDSEKLTTVAYGDELGHETFKADLNHPIVFHLRKKGIGVDLITSQHGMSPDFSIHIPRDGTPIKVDFMKRQVGDNGQMIISEDKPEYKNWKQATNWWFRLEIPSGGFVEENDEFPFEASASGYQPVVEFNFQRGQTAWIENLKKNYYIKFGNPPLYGRLQIETGISYGGSILTYAINPDGSRNLESK
jgi:hypothetical protein